MLYLTKELAIPIIRVNTMVCSHIRAAAGTDMPIVIKLHVVGLYCTHARTHTLSSSLP